MRIKKICFSWIFCFFFFFSTSFFIISLSGCAVIRIDEEKTSFERLTKIGGSYRPGNEKPSLPVLSEKSGLSDYLEYSMLNNPKIEAAYHDWYADVQSVTVARSLPDPRLTFSSSITSILDSVMAGLMVDLPGKGKLRLAGLLASIESEKSYFVFEREILKTAYTLKTAYYRLQFLHEKIRVEEETLALIGELEAVVRLRNAEGMSTLQDILRVEIEMEELSREIGNLKDSRSALISELKSALGLGPMLPDPPLPVGFTPSAWHPDPDAVLETALKQNPLILQMEADLRQAEAAIDLAKRSKVPDLSLGLEGSFSSGAPMWSPSVGMTLPLFRDKISAQIARAEAEKRSAGARLSNEQIEMATEFASILYLYRESMRNMKVMEGGLLPKARRALEAVLASYSNGRSAFLDVIDGFRQVLSFELALIDAGTKRELSLAALSLLIKGEVPLVNPLGGEIERQKNKGTKEVLK